ncbi:MAG: IS256 family transposase, partial [Candidatus Nanopelagicales bacterium]
MTAVANHEKDVPVAGAGVELPEEFLDLLIERYRAGEVELTGSGGFIASLIKAVLERGLQAELADHLGYDRHDRAGHGSGNSRNGYTSKTLSSEVGPVEVDTPRDRAGTFTPQLVPKGERHLGSGLSDMIISLYAGGMTVRDIQAHLGRTLQVELSHETIANVTDAVLEEVYAWQTRPLEPVYPIVYLDAIVVKVKENNQVRNKSAHIVIGVDLEGAKSVLGIWVQNSEGAKFWAGVCAELRNRGVTDILIACCDGLKGLPEAIEATWPQTTVQTCVVHLIRASMRFVSYTDRKAVAGLLKPIYTAATLTDAETAMVAFADSDMGRKYPSAVKTWTDSWERFIPFLEFPPEVRRVIYTTNSIESLHYGIRKIIKNRGHFPNDTAAVKLIWLAIRDIEDKAVRRRAKERGKPEPEPRADGQIRATTVQGWKRALNQLAAA